MWYNNSMKKCTDCKQYMEEVLFYRNKSANDGLCNICKECTSIRKKDNYLINSDLIKEKTRIKNAERRSKGLKRYGNKELVKECKKRYYLKYKERLIKDSYEKKKKRLKEDSLFKFKEGIRSLISISFRNKYLKKNTKTSDIIGCDFDTLQEYLNQTFFKTYKRQLNKDDKVHIDHIIPISTAKTKEDVIKLNHFNNLQYLLAEDNLKKSNKVNYVEVINDNA